jgi:hypothetical protein
MKRKNFTIAEIEDKFFKKCRLSPLPQECILAFKLPDSTRVVQNFHLSNRVQDVMAFLHSVHGIPMNYKLYVNQVPLFEVTVDLDQTLGALGLFPRSMLLVQDY